MNAVSLIFLLDILLGLLCVACRSDADVKSRSDIERDFVVKAEQAVRAILPDRTGRLEARHIDQLLRFLVAEGSIMEVSPGVFCLLQAGLGRISRGKVVAASATKGVAAPEPEKLPPVDTVSGAPCTQCPHRDVCSPTGE